MAQWAAVAVAAVVLVAGCSAVTDLGTPDSVRETTVTPAPVPDESPSPRTIPGVYTNGSVDADRLVGTHTEFIDAWTYTWEFRLVRTDPETDTKLINVTRRIRVGEEATIVRSWGSGGPFLNREVYIGETGSYQRVPATNESQRVDVDRSDDVYIPAGSILRGQLPDRGYRMRVVERSGREHLRIHHPPETPAFENVTRNYTVMAHVTRDGFVRDLSVTYTGLRGDRVSIEFEYTGVGNTTVNTPGWVTRLKESRADATAAARISPAPNAST